MRMQLQRTNSSGVFDTRLASTSLSFSDQSQQPMMNSINPNMQQLINTQQLINNKTQQFQLESQKTHMEFANSRIGSTASVSSMGSAAPLGRQIPGLDGLKSNSTSAVRNSNTMSHFDNKSKYEPFTGGLTNSRTQLNLQQPASKRDSVGGILNPGSALPNPNAINLNQFGLGNTEVYNPYSNFSKTNSMYGSPSFVLEKYRKTNLW
jgi:hypothetical protein